MEGGGERVRIYVGGLGEKVTADDLRKMLSPALGDVQAVEVIRSKGRSFGYMELVPSSPASLSKLFSTYNGCVWKGGKLRLEKAKEHYLARLHREWADNAPLPATTLSNDGAHPAFAASSTSKLPGKQLGPMHDKLSIFFPRLGKMKSIPFSGTGKHKYSFRRVQLSSPPEYFCDCDEHSGPPLIPRKEHSLTSEGHGAGINEKEILIMNSVINKLFAREHISDTLNSKTQGEKSIPETLNSETEGKSEAAASSNIIDSQLEDEIDSPLEDEVDSAVDEDDDLVINVARPGPQTVLANEVLKLKEKPALEDGPTPNVILKQRRSDAPSCKKHRSAVSGDKDANDLNSSVFTGEKACQGYSDAQENLMAATNFKPESGGKQSVPAPLSSRKSSWRKLLSDGDGNPFSISDILCPAGSSKEEESNFDKLVIPNDKDEKVLSSGDQMSTFQEPASLEQQLAEAKSGEPESTSNKTARGSAWLHESSWTQLISGSSSGFSIRQILPSAGAEKQDLGIHDQMEFSSSISRSEQVDEGEVGLDKDSSIENRNKQSTPRNNHVVGPALFEGNKESKATKSHTEDVAIGETCLFMRTEASVKEWASMKASLSGSRKRKKQS